MFYERQNQEPSELLHCKIIPRYCLITVTYPMQTIGILQLYGTKSAFFF